MKKTTTITLATLLLALLGYGIYTTRNIPSDSEVPSVVPEHTLPISNMLEHDEIDCWDDASCSAPGHELSEDDPGWNCATMGDRDCGPRWELWKDYDLGPLDGGITDCYALVGDTTILHCLNGKVTTT